jgi:hypothetical protein
MYLKNTGRAKTVTLKFVTFVVLLKMLSLQMPLLSMLRKTVHASPILQVSSFG